MRAFGWILLWFFTGACCFAQQDEKKLLERVLAKPDMSQINPMNAKKFDSGGFAVKKAAAGSSSFLYSQKASTEGTGTSARSLGSKIRGLEGKFMNRARQVFGRKR